MAAGQWQPLIVAEHSRRVITQQGNGTINAFTPTKAIAVDAQAPQTVRSIPVRAFCPTIMGEPGVLYLCGGLHSNYQGNEIDRMTLPPPGSTTVFTELSHQPAIPPEGADSGYASGSGGYVWRMYGLPMADTRDWQPFPGHQWTKQSYHPQYGFFSFTPFAQGNGSVRSAMGHPVPTGYNNFGSRVMGGVVFDWRTRRYSSFFDNDKADYRDAYLGETGLSDWSAWDQRMVALHTIRSETFMNAVGLDGRLSRIGSTQQIGGYDRSSGNGVIMRHLQMGQYLILRQDGNGTFSQRTRLLLWSPRFAGDGFVALTVPPSAVADVGRDVDALTFCVDRNSRRVFWMVFPRPGVDLRFYVSSFEDLMNWRPVAFKNSLQVPEGPTQDAYLASDRTPLHFLNGWLILNSKANIVGQPSESASDGYINGAISLLRVKVDAGEDLPPMNFRRYDYGTQGFRFSSGSGELQLIGSKHVNWAYRSADRSFYMCAGDAGASFTQSMARLRLEDGTARGYTFTELLNETGAIPQSGAAAAAGYRHRPYSPDDGAFIYLGASNRNPELADKFLFARGGDGAGFSSNVYTRPVYRPFAENPANWNGGSDTGSPGAVARMQADGWSGDKILLFDAVHNAFKETNTAQWAYDSGGEPLQHPSLQGSAACRNGAWDPARNTLWRFVDYNNTLTLCSYDFDNRQVKLYKVNVWRDDQQRLWFTDGQQPSNASVSLISANGLPDFGWYDRDANRHRTAAAHPWSHKELWLDERDGRLYTVSPSTGYLWCYETRGAVTASAGGGKTIPFYPVGRRIPLTGTYPATDSREFYPPRKFYEPGFRVGADTRMNSFIAPFKGGLLWWSSCHHEGGTFGRPLYAFWRRLGFTGDWTVVTLPVEFVANSLAPESLAIDNTALLAISCAGNPYDTPTRWPWFWRIT